MILYILMKHIYREYDMALKGKKVYKKQLIEMLKVSNTLFINIFKL